MNNSASKSKNKSNLTNSMSLVLWGSNLSCTAKIKYTRHQLSIVKLLVNVRNVIIGIILSDGNIALAYRSKNAYLMFS